jgi:hypothetical protein
VRKDANSAIARIAAPIVAIAKSVTQNTEGSAPFAVTAK